MAAGKSTIGPILANTLGWNFVDLDKAIEEEEAMKITNIFEARGEEYFRRKELEMLKAISRSRKFHPNVLARIGPIVLLPAAIKPVR